MLLAPHLKMQGEAWLPETEKMALPERKPAHQGFGPLVEGAKTQVICDDLAGRETRT